MKRLTRLFFVGVLFVGLALFNIGGCGGGGGGNGGGGVITNCQMPPLNTDFSDLGYVFIDPVASAAIGVTSDGEIVAIALQTIPFSGDTIGVIATSAGANDCVIFGATDLEIVFPATGTCERQAGGEVFVINDLSSLGVDFPQLVGECDEIISLSSAPAQSMELGRVLDAPDVGVRGTEGDEEETALRFRSIADAMSK